jgi:hypothetical protein
MTNRAVNRMLTQASRAELCVVRRLASPWLHYCILPGTPICAWGMAFQGTSKPEEVPDGDVDCPGCLAIINIIVEEFSEEYEE